ncbi:MAG: hypothetical protein MUO34_06800 [Ignavibacteriaceae bacterium]|nr:hypothetical protein [Ignavibacteriaceae bacterium]
MRYDPRRKDKVQELVCQSYEKFVRDTAADKEIKQQDTNASSPKEQRKLIKDLYVKKAMVGHQPLMRCHSTDEDLMLKQI